MRCSRLAPPLLSTIVVVALCLGTTACDDGSTDGPSACSGDECAGSGADVCAARPCGHGVCVEQPAGVGVCRCEGGWSGAACDACAAGYRADGERCVSNDAPDDPCEPNPCGDPGRSRCLPEGETHRCACDPGTHADGDECLPDAVCDPDSTCAGHGQCAGEGLRCSCFEGYTGDHCQECAQGYEPALGGCRPGDPCDPNPCQEPLRGQCVVAGGEPQCSCDPGYQDAAGDGVCRADCAEAELDCGDNGRCEVRQGHARCVCAAGYQDHDGDGTCEPTCATAGLQCGADEICSDRGGAPGCVAGRRPPIYISFHWHMHQPVYWPYEGVVESERHNRMGFSLYDIHFTRTGPYTDWPRNAVGAGRHLPHLGAQVSMSGSLIENLNGLQAAGAGFGGWTGAWREAIGWRTELGNPRLDLVSFGYHHPLMGLLDEEDLRLQVRTHRLAVQRNFGSPPGRGMFPPECAFSERMIPGLVGEGVEWVLVDNIHFDRTHVDYPFRPESNLPAPNRADAVNTGATDWVELRNLWAPSPVAAPWGYQPHWVQHTDPESGDTSRMIAVPAARYEGNEDGRGGFGALQYDAVMSQYEQQNSDPEHPMLVVLHHDGDNFGGGTDSYYHANFSNFVRWVESNPDRFVATTIQDYLDLFPPDPDDVIHVEDGSWSGADNGDAEFHKWNGDPGGDGYSPDRNSWGVITAVKNRVLTAEAILPHSSAEAIVDGDGNDTDRAWHFLLNAETSCYWYWDGSAGGLWDSHPTRAANEAARFADQVLVPGGPDPVGPTVYLPQREPYNPGVGDAPSDVTVWTYAYDVSGLSSVRLHWRVDADGTRDGANERYAGGEWQQVEMAGRALESRTDPQPSYKAEEFSAEISGLAEALVDYYVSATDSVGNSTRSPLMHVYIGAAGAPPVDDVDLWAPPLPTADDVITITYNRAANLHWGVDASAGGGGWSPPPAEYWPEGSVAWPDGLSIETPLAGPDAEGHYTVQLGPFNGVAVSEVNFVFHNADDSWTGPDRAVPIAR